MKILYSVQRYGSEIVGGSETACRLFAENLVARGHDVDVITSCAISYVDWSDHYTPGIEVINGVTVYRLPVEFPRDSRQFSDIHEVLMQDPQNSTLASQYEWQRAMGPILKGHVAWLREHASEYDVVVFMTYLYPTTAFGLPVVAGLVPTVLQPTAHDEPTAHLPMFQSLFRQPDSFIFFTEEERDTVRRIYGIDPTGQTVGIGMPLDQEIQNGQTFRRVNDLLDDPYLLYVGRLDTFKGVSELLRYFVEFKGHRPSSLKLVLAGEKVIDVPDSDDIVYVGFLDEHMKRDAIAGSIALVQPSPFESFSIVLCEAWLQRKPVLVQGWSDVMTGQVMRSQGGFPYNGFAEFEGCLQLLLTDKELAAELGHNGEQYVRQMYSWDNVLDKFEDAIVQAQANFAARTRDF
jgi:glycosyltransferase involved in cell wall biosynthesis